MSKEMFKCEKEFQKIMSNNIKIISQNSNIISLQYKKNKIPQTIANRLMTIEITQTSNQLLKKIANEIQFSANKDDLKAYSICQFDLRYTKLNKGSTIDCDNKHIKIGSKDDHCYGMILPDKEHVQGYSSGQHCFRMYYKNPYGPNKWLFFGIYKYGMVPKDMRSYDHETSWGIGDNTSGLIYCNGKCENDKSNMSFLYSFDENQIDMLVDFDAGILSYSIVDDKVKHRKYTFSKKFDTNIAYTVHLNFFWQGTEVQIAKTAVDMFGKNKKLVQYGGDSLKKPLQDTTVGLCDFSKSLTGSDWRATPNIDRSQWTRESVEWEGKMEEFAILVDRTHKETRKKLWDKFDKYKKEKLDSDKYLRYLLYSLVALHIKSKDRTGKIPTEQAIKPFLIWLANEIRPMLKDSSPDKRYITRKDFVSNIGSYVKKAAGLKKKKKGLFGK